MVTSIWDSVHSEFNRLVLQEQQLRIAAPNQPVKAAWGILVEAKVKQVFDQTDIPLIIYASACTAPAGKAPPQLLQIDVSDKVAFHSMLEALDGPKLDILLQSPGGFPEATETIVEEVRRKFGHVRFIVPAYAKSAATMMAMSGDEILIDEDGELGPIDPQMVIGGG
jgi:ClpP class serine protease